MRKYYYMATNFEPHECVIFDWSMKIGTHENKAIHSIINYVHIESILIVPGGLL